MVSHSVIEESFLPTHITPTIEGVKSLLKKMEALVLEKPQATFGLDDESGAIYATRPMTAEEIAVFMAEEARSARRWQRLSNHREKFAADVLAKYPELEVGSTSSLGRALQTSQQARADLAAAMSEPIKKSIGRRQNLPNGSDFGEGFYLKDSNDMVQIDPKTLEIISA